MTSCKSSTGKSCSKVPRGLPPFWEHVAIDVSLMVWCASIEFPESSFSSDPDSSSSELEDGRRLSLDGIVRGSEHK